MLRDICEQWTNIVTITSECSNTKTISNAQILWQPQLSECSNIMTAVQNYENHRWSVQIFRQSRELKYQDNHKWVLKYQYNHQCTKIMIITSECTNTMTTITLVAQILMHKYCDKIISANIVTKGTQFVWIDQKWDLSPAREECGRNSDSRKLFSAHAQISVHKYYDNNH